MLLQDSFTRRTYQPLSLTVKGITIFITYKRPLFSNVGEKITQRRANNRRTLKQQMKWKLHSLRSPHKILLERHALHRRQQNEWAYQQKVTCKWTSWLQCDCNLPHLRRCYIMPFSSHLVSQFCWHTKSLCCESSCSTGVTMLNIVETILLGIWAKPKPMIKKMQKLHFKFPSYARKLSVFIGSSNREHCFAQSIRSL